MANRRWQALATFLAACALAPACGVDDVDFSNKKCPCPDDLVCDSAANRCVAPGSLKKTSKTGGGECVPRSCVAAAAECGPADDGCGHVIDCGKCGGTNMACDADTHKCICQPKDCAAQGAECGEVPSGCGQTFKCDACPGAKPNCGGAGPNKCGTTTCVPDTCRGRCGKFSDFCGGVLDCGGCTAPQTCGGGTEPDKCGCTPKTCSQLAWQCGSGNDGCGGTLQCPSCGSGKECSNSTHTCHDDD
jgi:hypothetical protein